MPYVASFKIRNAVRYLKAGEIIAYPTEAVYGIGCDPLNKQAVMRLLRIKNRPVSKGLILIAASLKQLKPYLQLNKDISARVEPTWPGPVTWVIPAQDWVPNWLTGEHDSLAVRVTDHLLAKQLCAQFGRPLVSTSANVTGKPAYKAAHKLHKAFAGQRIFIVSGKIGALSQETSIYDAVQARRLR